MNIKKRMSKFISLLISFTIVFGNVIPAYAMEDTNSDSAAVVDGENISAEERNLEDITVTYQQASSFFVTIPKTIVLDGWKQSAYAVKVSGDIGAEQCVYVAPVDGIEETENIDFYMKDQASENAKEDVVANVTHNKFHWNSAEVAQGYNQDDNMVNALELTAGTWRGIFQMEIKLETHVTHKHNYVETITKEPTCTEEGEKTYTCECGDSYTEKIPATGHSYVDGECEHCGEKDPNHEHQYTGKVTKEPTCTEEGEKTYTCECGDSYTEKIPATGHNYTETITKEPTCTEEGEKTYTCENCGDSYTEKIPATGHDYVDGICENCGEADPDHHDWKPLWFEVSELPSTKTADALTSGAGKTQSASNNLTITVPEWYPTDIAYTYDYSYEYSGYTSGSVQCGSFSTYRSSSSSSSSGNSSGSKEMMLAPGDNVITVSARCSSNSTNGSGYRRWLIRGTFPSLGSCLDKTQHYCPHCQTYEEHYSTCTDPTKDEYYFCEKCGLQFRHRCKFDEAQTAVAECTGGYFDC